MVEAYPADGAGFDCAPSDGACGVPTNATIVLRFDRFLLPTTAIRQSITLYTGDKANTAPTPSSTRPELSPEYDLLERAVRYRLPPGFELEPRTLYTYELPIAATAQLPGFRAFDGAPLEGTRPLRFSFFTADGPEPPPAPATAPSCDELLDTCIGGGCHGSSAEKQESPPMGLALDSWDAIGRTAVGRVAHQTEIGASIGRTDQAPIRFGANMPIIDPGRPDNSYLMYKLLLAPEAYDPCPNPDPDPGTEAGAWCGSCPADDRCEPPDGAELERLAGWFVRGAPMPYGDGKPGHAMVASLQAFIRTPEVCPEGINPAP